MEKVFDIGIIGLGPAGHKAALEALRAGFSVIAFEKSKPGGTCLNLGCVPTKAILHSSEIFAGLRSLTKEGLEPCIEACFQGIKEAEICNIKGIYERKNKITEKFCSAIKKDLTAKGLALVEFEAKIKEEDDGFKIISDGRTYNARNIIIATGSAPFELPSLKFDHKNILNSDDVLNLDKCPKSVVIVGSGAIGIEWARIFSNLGCKTAIVEKAENLLPESDRDVSKRILRMFKMAKIQAYTGDEVIKFEDGIAHLKSGKELECEKILVAVGRRRIFPEIEFKDKDCKLSVNADGTTNFGQIYAIGDAIAKKMLAHTANAQAVRVIEKIKTRKCAGLSDLEIPSVVYGEPEIASIGLREQDLPDDYINNSDYKIYNLPLTFLAKAWCDGAIDGFIKIITKCDKIIGAHIISKEASALVTQIQIAMKAGMSLKDLQEVIFAHPTYSEGISEALNL